MNVEENKQTPKDDGRNTYQSPFKKAEGGSNKQNLKRESAFGMV